MAAPRLGWKDIPLAVPCDTAEVPLQHPPLPRPVAVSMGNPHAIFFVEDVRALDVAALGAELERHPFFPERANIGFAQMLGPTVMRLRVFERGAGLTLACGSGACAAMVAAVRRGLAEDRCRIFVDGGELLIEWPGEGPVYMTGTASLSFEGVLAPEMLA
jgi:diaminopimelate epimerase